MNFFLRIVAVVSFLVFGMKLPKTPDKKVNMMLCQKTHQSRKIRSYYDHERQQLTKKKIYFILKSCRFYEYHMNKR